ncbi:MAG: ABC transporter permease [Acidimicrobiales bacterium]|jgi:putative ABC transport system permease protein|nr:ABC transporter permease [Acidimicrobiales bacterium]
MRLAVLELRRKPLRFAVVGTALWLLTVLLLFLGGLLDGLYLGSTGVLRQQDAQLLTFSSDSRTSLIRSRIDVETRQQVEAVPGVADADGLGLALVGARVPDETEPANTAVVGYETATGSVPDPPAAGTAWADRSLEANGVSVGDVLEMGPQQVPLEVVGWIEDGNYLGQSGLWVDPATWRGILASSRPDSSLPEGTFQTLAVTVADGADPDEVAAAIDAATGGLTRTVDVEAAIGSIPGIDEQASTFNQIIGTTLLVAGVVVALFFALLTLERTRLYGVFKAIGASSRQIFASVLTQSLVITAVSFVLGTLFVELAALGIPPGAVPFQLEPARILSSLALLLVVATLGSVISLRRVTRIDPASAIG